MLGNTWKCFGNDSMGRCSYYCLIALRVVGGLRYLCSAEYGSCYISLLISEAFLMEIVGIFPSYAILLWGCIMVVFGQKI